MGMVESDIEIIFDERNIKTFAVVADNNFVFLNVLDEIIQVLSLNISFNRLAIIKSDCGNFVKLAVKSCSFNVQVSRGIPELGK